MGRKQERYSLGSCEIEYQLTLSHELGEGKAADHGYQTKGMKANYRELALTEERQAV